MADKQEIAGEIVNAFAHKYSWLGKQFAEELLTSFSSFNIESTFSKQLGHERVRSHLLLFWPQGWLKSSLLLKARDLIGEKYCSLLTDITRAALRGTVEYTEENTVIFNRPKVLRSNFIIASELGTLTSKGASGGEDLNQMMLAMLEESVVSVELSKFAKITDDQRAQIIEDNPGLKFKGNTEIEYETHAVWLAGTYNSKYIMDSAFSSRWEIMIPAQNLDSHLTKYIGKHRWMLPEDIPAKLQHILNRPTDQKFLDAWNEDLPDEVYDVHPNISPRFARAVKVYRVCSKMYWEQDVKTEELVQRMRYVIHSQATSRQSLKDEIQAYLKKVNTQKNYDQLKETLQVDGMELAKALESFPKLKGVDGDLYYYAKTV